jgi:hypothetical protein
VGDPAGIFDAVRRAVEGPLRDELFTGLWLPILIVIATLLSKLLTMWHPDRKDLSIGVDLYLSAISALIAATGAIVTFAKDPNSDQNLQQRNLNLILLGLLVWQYLALAWYMRYLGWEEPARTRPTLLEGVAVPIFVGIVAIMVVFAANSRVVARLLGVE